MKGAETYDGWLATFARAGIAGVNGQAFGFNSGSFAQMLRDEGLRNTLRVLKTYVTNNEVRNRMRLLDRTFNEYPDYFGYGIHSFRK